MSKVEMIINAENLFVILMSTSKRKKLFERIKSIYSSDAIFISPPFDRVMLVTFLVRQQDELKDILESAILI